MEGTKHHVVCIPAPAQGHINPMTNLAKLLHSKGFRVTFVHTQFNFDRVQPVSLDGFSFEAIPDGLPPDNKRGASDLPALCRAMTSSEVHKNALRSLLMKLTPVTCVILDAQLNFALNEVVKELGVRVMLFHTASICAVLAYLHFDELVRRRLLPLSDKNIADEFLDAPIDWIPGLIQGAKLKHLPSFVRTNIHISEMLFINFNIVSAKNMLDSEAVILNTFDDLEDGVLQGIKTKIPNILTIGPLRSLCEQAVTNTFGSNLWEEDDNCLSWLDKRNPKSVIYVNYGSLATLTSNQLEEFAWGLANSKQHFLWVIREDVVNRESCILSKEYMEEIKDRGLVSGWCHQEKVLKHPSVAVFLTHCGWNSTLESICEGVPMVCWPFFADQTTNCAYICDEWGIEMEIGEGEVKREGVEDVVREMMEGEKGKKIRVNVMELKNKVNKASKLGGSSYNNFDNFVEWLMNSNYRNT